MALSAKEKGKIREEYGRHPRDTGSSEFQVALLTERIKHLTEHIQSKKKDHHSQRSLILLVSKRQKHLNYIKRANPQLYRAVVEKLGLRK